MHQELKSWGYPGGGSNPLLLKSDGERPIVAVRESLARCLGSMITPEMPPKGEHQAEALQEEGKAHGQLPYDVQALLVRLRQHAAFCIIGRVASLHVTHTARRDAVDTIRDWFNL